MPLNYLACQVDETCGDGSIFVFLHESPLFCLLVWLIFILICYNEIIFFFVHNREFLKNYVLFYLSLLLRSHHVHLSLNQFQPYISHFLTNQTKYFSLFLFLKKLIDRFLIMCVPHPQNIIFIELQFQHNILN